MESIFKVGDIVRIRDLRELEKKYGGLPLGVSEEMCAMKGGLHTITDVVDKEIYDVESYEHLRPFNPDGCRYRISGDSGKWQWSSPMLELVASAELSCVLTKEMVESAISSYKEALKYVTLPIGESLWLKGTDEKKENKLELKVKNVRKVKLNFKN